MAPLPTRQEIVDALSSRHGAEIQQMLGAASVTICGLGGLGSNIAFALARSGVGRLHLIDFDRVDITNLNRLFHTIHNGFPCSGNHGPDLIATVM